MFAAGLAAGPSGLGGIGWAREEGKRWEEVADWKNGKK